jgi:hypothetical protein
MARVIYNEFKSIEDFIGYINDTPLNALFRWEQHCSVIGDYRFTGTRSYEEAMGLLKNGWDDMAKRIETKLNLIANEVQPKTTQRSKYDVVGFQASVPRYLQGIPTNMINKKPVVQKQKVITIVKHIGYLWDVSADKIVENSIKALMIVKKIEAQGYRVNLDVISPAEEGNEIAICRVRVKSASERLNVSKVAFPMVHPDMLRRMVFRFREVNPEIKNHGWSSGMGCSIYDRARVKSFLKENEYYLHNFIGDVDEEIKNLNLK